MKNAQNCAKVIFRIMVTTTNLLSAYYAKSFHQHSRPHDECMTIYVVAYSTGK